MPVDEKTYFEMQLDSTIRETEKLLKKLKENTAPGDVIEKWWKAWNKGGGQVLPGLVKRRAAEYALYSKGFFLITVATVLFVAAATYLTIKIVKSW